jgi:hypothetical protein
MSKQLKLLLVVLLVVLTIGSAALFLVAVASQSTAYDPAKVKLDIKLNTREEILTCAYKTYGDDSQNMWAAKTLIKNTGKIPVYDFKIWYKVGDFTDWTSGEEYPEIRPGQTVRDYCWPTLNDEKVKAITTKTPVELVMKYEYRGLKQPVEDYKKIFLLGRNDFVFSSLAEKDRLTFADNFDNYRFVAAFITPNEAATKYLANTVGSGLETRVSDQDALEAFKRAFDTLRAQGVKYIMEPEAFWAGSAAQYVQYPKETIERRSGTCLDLSITMSALMEAIGVKSYVALMPGHAIPLVELPESGDIYAIESTFLDKDYALNKHGDAVSAEVTASECITLAKNELEQAEEEGKLVLINPSYWWKEGVMPSW